MQFVRKPQDVPKRPLRFPVPSPNRGDRRARPRLAPVAPSELEELSSPPRPKTCAIRRKTALILLSFGDAALRVPSRGVAEDPGHLNLKMKRPGRERPPVLTASPGT